MCCHLHQRVEDRVCRYEPAPADVLVRVFAGRIPLVGIAVEPAVAAGALRRAGGGRTLKKVFANPRRPSYVYTPPACT